MSLGSALATAMSGLRANQAALAVVSSNIANAQTPGYVTQSVNQIAIDSGTAGASVSVTGVNRELDHFIQTAVGSPMQSREISFIHGVDVSAGLDQQFHRSLRPWRTSPS